MTSFVDTNVLVRHLTGEPADMAARATGFLESSEELLLVDLVVAECVYVLGSVYGAGRAQIAAAIQAVLALESIRVVALPLLERTLELYESRGLGFADAYLVACAELTGIGDIASFDEAIDRVPSVTRVAP